MAEWMQMAGDAYAVRVPIKPGGPGISGPVSGGRGEDDRSDLQRPGALAGPALGGWG